MSAAVRTWSMVAVIAVVAVLMGTPIGPAAAAGPYTSYAISGEDGDPIVGNRGYVGPDVRLGGNAKHIDGYVGEWSLGIDAPPGDQLRAGQTYDITGAPLTYHEGAALLISGQGEYCSAPTGTFTLHELTFDQGDRLTSLLVTFTLRCSGASGQAYGSVALNASTPAPPVPPALTLRMPTKKVDYGSVVAAQARVSAGVPGTVISLYRRTADGVDELVAQAAADSQGYVALSLRVVETTTVTARVAGNGAFPDRVASQTVPVRGKVKAKVLGKGPTRDGAHLVPVGSTALVGALLRPDHRGDCVRFRLEVRVQNYWGHDVHTKCLRLNRKSAVAVRVPGDPRLIGIPVRIRAHWKGDDRNLEDNSRWIYLRFVR